MTRLTITLLATLTACAPAYAVEPQCGTVESVAQYLAQRGERPLVTGGDIDGNHVSIWYDVDSQEWSYVVTDPEAMRTCLVNYGIGMMPFSYDEGEPA